MTKECKQQFTLRITQANKTELIVILYEMLLAYTQDAKISLQEGNTEAFRDNIRKADNCLTELTDTRVRFVNTQDAPAYFGKVYRVFADAARRGGVTLVTE